MQTAPGVNTGLLTAIMLFTAVVIVAWIIWGVREYRRTGRPQWLWMAVLMLVSLFVTWSRVL
ncbi:MAG: hypothetical protein WCF04_10085 [Candidatus Nanopelagicales bacterium]